MNVLKRFLLSFMLMLTCTILYAQTEITGTVVDETGETVIGARSIPEQPSFSPTWASLMSRCLPAMAW